MRWFVDAGIATIFILSSHITQLPPSGSLIRWRNVGLRCGYPSLRTGCNSVTSGGMIPDLKYLCKIASLAIVACNGPSESGLNLPVEQFRVFIKFLPLSEIETYSKLITTNLFYVSSLKAYVTPTNFAEQAPNKPVF
jgi:hypothetical protein